jgi:serine/threonine protein phosphatase PrpC
MPLKIHTGQYSDKGRKPGNQDCHGIVVPQAPLLDSKGITVALADGISSSEAGAQAAQAAVRSLLDDYYCTSDAWSVKTAVERVLVATNSWLHAQTQAGHGRHDKDRGWVCTLSAMVIKSRTAHLFHVGDSRIYQVHAKALEPLTTDHRLRLGPDESYLARALGVQDTLEIDHRSLALSPGDTFLLLTDGIWEHVPEAALLAAIERHGDDLDAAARAMADEALQRGSPDNLTALLLRVQHLPEPQASEVARLASELPFPPLLEPRMAFDGYRIVRTLHSSSRSHVYLAVDEDSGETVVIKAPSIDLRDDPAYLERFLLEEWVARRVNSPHVLKPRETTRARHFLYVVTEYVEGVTLTQWMVDHPRADLATVRRIALQIARGLRAFHRMEMLHQDLRPENILIDATGTVKIIDFGSVQVAGLLETAPGPDPRLLGTPQYAAPECLLGEAGSAASDQFSLAVIIHQMLTGRLPYGLEMAKCQSRVQQKRLKPASALLAQPRLPAWVDDALHKALQPEPHKRYADVDEFVFALHTPDPAFVQRRRMPLIERNPLLFWKALSLLLAMACLALLARLLH